MICDDIKKILIINRGEIVSRIAKTAQRLEITTVSVYSDVDENSPHIEQTDECIRLEGKLSKDTYLNFEKILHAVEISGADAVHPGFGFVSESADFAEFMNQNGIRFIGPSPESIRCMGDKIESKIIAKKAGVNVIPGLIEPINDIEFGIKISNEIGYPVMLKATAGGGGKGIRVVWNDQDFKENFLLVQKEAQESFGDGRIFIEKYIENPRHIEIQILGDKFGNVVHLGERECTIQRRHQKVIEEAPSPFFTNLGKRAEKIRSEMGKQSVALAKTIGYYSVGTVEFVVDGKGNFYFLEVNTRLQVEHPITEEAIRIHNKDGTISKLDLVEWMIKVENSERLTFSQKDIHFDKASIEVRVYAENPEANFLPSSGKIVNYNYSDIDTLRIESGIEKGSVISTYYDPMISKICVYGLDRNEAIKNLTLSLSQLVIYGDTLKTNINFLEQLIRLPEFISGDFSTNFIKQKYSEGFSEIPSIEDSEILKNFLIIGAIFSIHNQKFLEISNYKDGDLKLNILTNIDGYQKAIRVELHKLQDKFQIVSINNLSIAENYKFIKKENHIVTIEKINENNETQEILYFKYQYDDIHFFLENSGYKVRFIVYPDGYENFLEGVKANSINNLSDDKFILSPLPGRIVSVLVKKGDKVEINTNLLTIEAMKMQNVIYSKKNGIIKNVFIDESDSVQADQKLIEFE